jgi:hypothetical protein
MKIIILTLLGVSLLTATSVSARTPQRSVLPQTKSWFLQCESCHELIKKCSDNCMKTTCNQCVAKIQNAKCKRCGRDIINQAKDLFFCDNSVPLHQLACQLSCRSRNVNPFNRGGVCDDESGLCVCCTFNFKK